VRSMQRQNKHEFLSKRNRNVRTNQVATQSTIICHKNTQVSIFVQRISHSGGLCHETLVLRALTLTLLRSMGPMGLYNVDVMSRIKLIS